MDKKTLTGIEIAGGMALVLFGRKIEGLALFAKGIYDLEKDYKERNKEELDGTFNKRWEKAITFYEETHQQDLNRKLHMAGIPLILAGATGLLTQKPYKPNWFLSAGSFAVGWGLNILGHAVVEKNEPAFFEDPLSFVAGPVWDIKQMTGVGKK